MAVVKTEKFPAVVCGSGVKRAYYKFELNGETEGAISIGGNIIYVSYTNRVNEGQGLAFLNYSDNGSTVANGTVFFNGFASTDDILDVEVTFR